MVEVIYERTFCHLLRLRGYARESIACINVWAQCQMGPNTMQEPLKYKLLTREK